MTRIYLPSVGPDAWQQLLAKPELHWATGYSARTLAHSWEAAAGLPPEIAQLLKSLGGEAELLLALPEHKTPLPGGRRESQSDVFALLRVAGQLVACTIEGKVDEPFGPTVEEWLVDASSGKQERLGYLAKLLGLSEPVAGDVRYQLFHRTASAVVEAQRFGASGAAMIVHSFSPDARWFEDYARFCALFGLTAKAGQLLTARLPDGKLLYLGWAGGDQRFRAM